MCHECMKGVEDLVNYCSLEDEGCQDSSCHWIKNPQPEREPDYNSAKKKTFIYRNVPKINPDPLITCKVELCEPEEQP